MPTLAAIAYLVAAACFIIALKGLASPKSARTGNKIGMIGMAIAIATTLLLPQTGESTAPLIGIALGGLVGTGIALRIKMTQMPQLVAAFHSLVGLSAVLVAGAALNSPTAFGIGTAENIHTASLVEMALGAFIGAVTFTGSLVAFAKLQGGKFAKLPRFTGHRLITGALGFSLILLVMLFVGTGSSFFFLLLVLASLALGYMLIVPVGGADMPVVVSMLNSYSGWAASGIGFTLNNPLLIITGALVGSSGAILSYIMCRAMNRSLVNVIFGGFGAGSKGVATRQDAETRPVNQGNPDDAAFLMKNAASVIIVPGYGMAVAQAQHVVREMADLLKSAGVKVRFAIHPVAGRMPGHMNVLLAEAGVSYDDVFELEDINRDFSTADVAFVIGANDVTNPAAKTDPHSPIYGMPVLEVEKARHVLFVKRGMSPGYAGVENELFYKDNTLMLFGDAKQMTDSIVKAMKVL